MRNWVADLPSDRVRHLSVDEVIEIHRRLIATFGGEQGIRDLGLLESALFRPQTGHYADLADMATALFESLLMNHPFIDGNKRVAFFATDVFLRLNGWQLHVEARTSHKFLITLMEQGQCDFESLAPWIRSSMEQLPEG